MDEQHRVGTIRKHWNGFFRELMEMDKFGIHFPRDLDVKIKAVLLGAAILIVSIVKLQTNLLINYLLIKEKKYEEQKDKKKYCCKKGIFHF